MANKLIDAAEWCLRRDADPLSAAIGLAVALLLSVPGWVLVAWAAGWL